MRNAELTALTGIRFYAALFVLLSHLPEVIPGMGGLGGQYLVFNAGVVSVSFFFVLSGFILTYKYAEVFRNGISKTTYLRFVWDRLTRIYPVHLLTMFMSLPIAALSPNHPLDWRAFPFHGLLFQCWWPSAVPRFYYYLNIPSWSISCEWFFYLLAPMAIFFVLGPTRRWTVPVGLSVGYASVLGLLLWQGRTENSQLHFVSWFAPSRFPEFLVGIFLARFFLAAPNRERGAIAGLAQAAGFVLIIAGAVYRQHAPWPLWGGLLYVPGSALLILGLAYGGGPFAAHLSRPWVNRLGMASFSLYLVHAPILVVIKNICISIAWEVKSWVAFGAMTLAMFLLLQAAAFIIYYRYEIPLQRRLRSLLKSPREVPSGGKMVAAVVR